MRSPSPDPWFRSSERDLGMARHLLGAGFYEGVAFHSQQAAEKILKGLLISRHCLWRRTHSGAELLAALARLGKLATPAAPPRTPAPTPPSWPSKP